MITIGQRIAQEIAADPAKSVTQCALFAGLGKSTLSELISGRSKSSTKLHLIAEYLGVEVKWLETGRGPKHRGQQGTNGVSTSDATDVHLVTRPFMRVPVVGTASLGMDGFWANLEYPVGHGDGYFMFPTQDKDAYVVRVVGNSMHPAIISGWYVLLEPNSQPQTNEFILVRLLDGRSTVKQLAYHRDHEYGLRAINGDEMIILNDDEIEAVHPVAAIMPPSGRKV